jgi:hypothetical protein
MKMPSRGRPGGWCCACKAGVPGFSVLIALSIISVFDVQGVSTTVMPPTKVLLLGATGGCGRQVCALSSQITQPASAHLRNLVRCNKQQALMQLLDRGVQVTAIVRSEKRLPEAAIGHPLLTLVEDPDGVNDMRVPQMAAHLNGHSAVVSCLGHNPTIKGIFGHPRDLCVDAASLVCAAAKEMIMPPQTPIKYIVVNSGLVDRPDGKDPVRSWLERPILWLLEVFLPAHMDNVKTSRYLYEKAAVESCHAVEFCVVRPEILVDGDDRGPQPDRSVHATRQNGIFKAGTTTRASVGHFIADLVTENHVWEQWRGGFPQIFNVASPRRKTS